MYAIRVFGLRLSVSADDLGIPAYLALLVRLPWIAVNGAFMYLVAANEELKLCSSEEWTKLVLFTGALLGVATLSALLFLSMTLIASRGSLLEPEKRWAMGPALYALLACYVGEIVVNVFGAVLAASWPAGLSACSEVLSEMRVFVICGAVFGWLDVCTFFACWYLFLNRNKVSTTGLRLDEFELKSLEWQKRCRRWCDVLSCLSCGFYGYHPSKVGAASDQAYSMVGEVFASFFTDMRLTPTELLAGLFLTKAEQTDARRRRETRHGAAIRVEPASSFSASTESGHVKVDIERSPAIEYKNSSSSSSSAIRVKAKLEKLPSSERDAELSRTLAELHDVLCYSESANSWKLHMLQSVMAKKTFSGLGKLFKNALQANLHRRRAPRGWHSHDNCCSMSHTAFIEMSGLRNEDLIFSHFASYASEVIAFGVATDHAKRTVVVSLRGSLALADFLTDACILPEHLLYHGRKWGFDGAGHYAHSGMLAAAVKIRSLLEETGVLHKLLRKPGRDQARVDPQASLNADERTTVEQYVEDSRLPDCSGYRLVVIGESLGAGVAAILSLLLKPAFPELKGYGMSTPGCIFDRELCDAVEPYFTTVFVGKDMVPRANWSAIHRVLNQSLHNLRRCKVNKNAVLRSAFSRAHAEDLMYATEEEVPRHLPAVKRLDDIIAKFNDASNENMAEFAEIPTFCPGKLVHLCKVQTVDSPRCCGARRAKRTYEPWFVRDRAELASFEISSSMIMDHMPHRVRDALEDVLVYCDQPGDQ